MARAKQKTLAGYVVASIRTDAAVLHYGNVQDRGSVISLQYKRPRSSKLEIMFFARTEVLAYQEGENGAGTVAVKSPYQTVWEGEVLDIVYNDDGTTTLATEDGAVELAVGVVLTELALTDDHDGEEEEEEEEVPAKKAPAKKAAAKKAPAKKAAVEDDEDEDEAEDEEEEEAPRRKPAAKKPAASKKRVVEDDEDEDEDDDF